MVERYGEIVSVADSISALPTKICTKCGGEFPVTEFRWRNKAKGMRHGFCKSCNKIKDKKYYINSEIRRKNIRIRHKKQVVLRKKWYKEFRSKLKCQRCGYNKCIEALEFHHRDPSEKECSISNMARNCYSMKRVLKELEKCDVLCANCHREEHFL